MSGAGGPGPCRASSSPILSPTILTVARPQIPLYGVKTAFDFQAPLLFGLAVASFSPLPYLYRLEDRRTCFPETISRGDGSNQQLDLIRDRGATGHPPPPPG